MANVPHMDKYKRLVKLGSVYPELFSINIDFVNVNTPIYKLNHTVSQDNQAFHDFSYSQSGNNSGNVIPVNELLLDEQDNQSYSKSPFEQPDDAWLIEKLKQLRRFGSYDLFKTLFYEYAFKINALTSARFDFSVSGKHWAKNSYVQIEIGEITEENQPVIVDVEGLKNVAVRNAVFNAIRSNFPDYEVYEIGSCDDGKTCRVLLFFGTPDGLNALADFHIEIIAISANGTIKANKRIQQVSRRIIFETDSVIFGDNLEVDLVNFNTAELDYFDDLDDFIKYYESLLFHLVSNADEEPPTPQECIDDPESEACQQALNTQKTGLYIGWLIYYDIYSLYVFNINDLFDIDNYTQTKGAITFNLKRKYKAFELPDLSIKDYLSYGNGYISLEGAFNANIFGYKRTLSTPTEIINETFFYIATIDSVGNISFSSYVPIEQGTSSIIYTDTMINCTSGPGGIIDCWTTYINPVPTIAPYNSYLRTYEFNNNSLLFYNYGRVIDDFNVNRRVEFDEEFFYGNYLKSNWKNSSLHYDGQQVHQLKYVDYYFDRQPYRSYNIEKLFVLRPASWDNPYDFFVMQAPRFVTHEVHNDASLSEPFYIVDHDFYGFNKAIDIMMPSIQLQIPFVGERMMSIIDTRKQQSICYVNVGYRASQAMDLYIAIQANYEDISLVESEIGAANNRLSQLNTNAPEYIEISTEVLPQLTQIKAEHETLIESLGGEDDAQIYGDIDELYRVYKEERLKMIVNNFCGITLIEELARLEQVPINYYII
jgi:hypothetical protein